MTVLKKGLVLALMTVEERCGGMIAICMLGNRLAFTTGRSILQSHAGDLSAFLPVSGRKRKMPTQNGFAFTTAVLA